MNQKHDREKVLKTGRQLFCSRGYNSLGVDEICKSTGMTKGAFYNAFKSKENFLLDTIHSYGVVTTEYLKSKLKNKNIKAIDRISAMYADLFDMQPKNNYTGCMINNVMSELGTSNELVCNATALEFEKFLRVIEPCVKEAQADGDISSNISSKMITELLHSTFYGALTRAKSLHNHKQGKLTMQVLINSLKQA